MKNFYFAIIIEENKKYYSYALKVNETDNLISKLKIKNIYAANICTTKKQAAALVEYWRACFKANNTYLLSEAGF